MLRLTFTGYFKSRGGNFSIMLALMMMVVLICVGAAYDGTKLTITKAKLNDAADSAALAAVRAKSQNVKNPEKVGEDYFRANIQALGKITVNDFNIDLTQMPSQKTYKAVATYDAQITPSFMGMFGFNSLSARGLAEAVTGVNKVHITILMDNSASMGIGATEADQDLMIGAVSCTLSCHMDYDATTGKSSLDMARDAGAEVRIDVARRAVASLLQRIDDDMDFTQLDVEVLTFSNDQERIFGPAKNIQSAIKKLANVDLTRKSPSGGTNLHYALENLRTDPKSAHKSDTLRFTIILTDGLEDQRMETTYPRQEYLDPNFVRRANHVKLTASAHIQVIDPAYCEALRDDGHNIYILNTVYEPLSHHSKAATWHDKTNNFLPNIRPALVKCAGSSDHVFDASSPDEIILAGDKIFETMLSKIYPRLSL